MKLDAEKQETMPQAYPETMMLPGTTSAAGLGMPNSAKETGCLTDAYRFEGAVWFMRTFTAGDWTGEQTMLTLERTRKTTVYLDGPLHAAPLLPAACARWRAYPCHPRG